MNPALIEHREELAQAGHPDTCGVFWNYPSVPRCTCALAETTRALVVCLKCGGEAKPTGMRGWQCTPGCAAHNE